MWKYVSAGAFLAMVNQLVISTESAGNEALNVAVGDGVVSDLSDENVESRQPQVAGNPQFPVMQDAETITDEVPKGKGFVKGEALRVDEEGAEFFIQELEQARAKMREARNRLALSVIFVLLVSVAIVAFAKFVLPGSWQDFTDIFREEALSDVVMKVEDYIADYATTSAKSTPLILLIVLFLYSFFYFFQKTAAFVFALSSFEILRLQQPRPQPREKNKVLESVQEAPVNVKSD
ncbi:hypothetical protein ACSSS7_002582 [Eimeria intestinalis]